MPVVGPPITGSARRIRYSNQSPIKVKESDWQTRAWEVYDRLGEVFFMTRYRKGIASKIDYFVAEQENVTDDPIPIESGPILAAFEELGGAQMLRKIVSGLMPHWDVAGEGYVVGFDEDPQWRVMSTQELKRQGDRMVLYDGDQEAGSLDPEQVFRVWSPHPRWSKQADSPTRHVLEPAEELILLSREVRARSLSRLPAGIWMIPEGLDLEAFEEEDGSGLDGFANELVRKMSRPISDPGDPMALVPWVIEMAKEDIEAAAGGFISFARDYQVSSDQREELLVRLATGLDLPAEIFLGLADVNHWGQWLITDHAVSRHAAPTIDEILESLTYGWFRPLFEMDMGNVVLWRDLSPATVPTDRSELTLKAHDRYLISDEAARTSLDFDEDSAPTPEEIEERVARTKRPSDTETNSDLPNTQSLLPILSAAKTVSGRELTQIDRRLLEWVVRESELAMVAVAELIPVGNGPVTAALVNLQDFDRFRQKVVDRIRQAQEATSRFVRRLTGRSLPDGTADAEIAGSMIVEALAQTLEGSAFTPGATPDPIDLGELPDSRAPVHLIRDALSVAGGAVGTLDSELIGNGQRSIEGLAQGGYQTATYMWEYGVSPRQANFLPHMFLDGQMFTGWDDPVLRNFSGFPSSSFYRPGDHRGCLCMYTREFVVGQKPAVQTQGAADLRALNRKRLDEKEMKPRPRIDDDPEIRRAARDKFEEAMAREASITPVLQGVADKTGGSYHMYQERVKFEASIREKIRREMDLDPSLTPTTAAAGLKDVNRYTLLWEPDVNYRTSHASAVKAMEDAGWTTGKNANAFPPPWGGNYHGMNYTFSKGDAVVEVQFNTPEGGRIKDLAHPFYERWRNLPRGDPYRAALNEEMVTMWNTNTTHVPPNMGDVGTPAFYDDIVGPLLP